MKIDLIKRKLLVKYPLFGSVVANTRFVADSTRKTAATDGKNIYYNSSFMDSLTEEEQTFIFAHEVCHIAFNHIFRAEGKESKVWNKATDAVINAYLKEDGLSFVKGGVDIAEAIHFDAEEMYEKLLTEKENLDEDEQNKEQGEDKEESEGIWQDDHSMWEEAIAKKKNEEKLGKDVKEEAQEKRIKEVQKELIELGEKEAFTQNKIERKKQLDELSKSLASASHGYGTDTESNKRTVTDIGFANPLIDWRIVLKEACKYEVDWSYKNAQIEDGVLTPYLEEIPILETEILLDTSGSIDETLLRNFLRECKNILQNSIVKVGCFDTKFYGFKEIKEVSEIDSFPFCGGGGTNFDVAVQAFTKRVPNKIIFTDGDARMPNTSMDVIWVVFGNKKINPLGGRVIYIDSDYLNRLYQTVDFSSANGMRR